MAGSIKTKEESVRREKWGKKEEIDYCNQNSIFFLVAKGLFWFEYKVSVLQGIWSNDDDDIGD